MKISRFDTEQKVMVVAEIGNNHEGSFYLADDLICRAAQAGVDAVKFQTFRTEHYVSRLNRDRFRRLKSFELTFSQFELLKQRADREGIIFLSTPFDIASAVFLNDLVPAFKISSGDNTFYPLLRTVAGFRKPIVMSTGMTDIDLLQQSVQFVYDAWGTSPDRPPLALLHCTVAYPTPPEQAQLAAIPMLRERFHCTVGYSDHTLGNEACAAACALGARIIEKHFTIDKNHSDFRDHALSADVADMTAIVQAIRRTEQLLGTSNKEIQPAEQDNTLAMRRSVVAARTLRKGDVITSDDITWVRPAGGVAPGREQSIINRRLLVSIEEGQMVLPEHLEGAG